nr:S-layer homology domain-containing protein [Filobacillus milosensis]
MTWSQFLNSVDSYYNKWSVEEGSIFKDVPDDHWAIEEIKLLKEKGVLVGYPDGTFGLHKTVTREEFAVGLANLYKRIKSEK